MKMIAHCMPTAENIQLLIVTAFVAFVFHKFLQGKK
jgi:hypothetical protein